MKKRMFIRAFTIVEMFVVIAVISIMLVITLINIQQSRLQARDKVRVADIQKIRLALEEYKLHCGEYPNKLELNTNNGCHNGEHLSDFLPNIPVAPQLGYTVPSFIHQYRVSSDNSYLYAGLSTSSNSGSKCYDYHIGVLLDQNEKHTGKRSKYLDQDHDATTQGIYNHSCPGSHLDFGNLSGFTSDADGIGLYDFRSTSEQ